MDAITIIGAAITAIDVIKLAYEGISKIAGLPKAFDKVKEQLPVVRATLVVAKHNAESRSTPLDELPYSQYQPISKLVKQCETNVKELERIFSSLEERCKKDQDAKSWDKARGWYIQILGGIKSHRVESLMSDVLSDMERLARYDVFQLTANMDQIQKAIIALSEVQRLDPSLPDSEFDVQGANHATQNIAQGGSGVQNNTVGGSHHFISGGQVLTGAHAQMNFVQSPESQEWIRELRVTDPRDDKTRIEKTKGGLLRDSYNWILSNRQFREWRDDPSPGPLWIRGGPGKGKTMLMCGIIDELKKELPTTTKPAYFFCQGTNENLNHATAVLRGLLFMLVSQHPHVHSSLKEKYKSSGKRLYEDANTWFSLSTILTEMLVLLDGKVMVIDALDECVTDRPLLLDLIVYNSRASRTKWIVSSRDWSDIRERLSGTADMPTALLELNDALVSEAVRMYIRNKVNELGHLKKYAEKTRDRVYQHLVDNSDNTFLWVALVCQELKASRPDGVFKILESFLAGLDSVYEQAMGAIEGSADKEPCKTILAVTCTVYRPVSLWELCSIAELPAPFRNRTGALETLITICRSFLTIQNDIIYFEHHSAKDFLMKNGSSWILPEGVMSRHRAIFTKSVDAMSQTLHRDIYGLAAPGFSIADVSPQDPDPLAPVKYSCTHWVDHLQDAQPTELTDEFIKDCDLAYAFLKEKFLYWLEAMSLLHGMLDATLAAEKLVMIAGRGESFPWYRKLHQWFQGGQEVSFVALARDCRRFVLYFKDIIATNPLQLYASALLFSPQRSIVRDLFFERDSPKWISLPPKMEEDWDECVQVLEPDSGYICGVAFSPDGRTIASACQTGAVHFWNALTGALKQTTDGHQKPAVSVAFSPDSVLAASGSGDGTIRLWDVASGRCVRTLLGHEDYVRKVTFSHDGAIIFSASYDKTVRQWEAASGLQKKTIMVDDFYPVAVSQTGAVAATYNQSLGLWDTTCGKNGWKLRSHNDYVNAVAFSPDGTTIASASNDNTIKFWDVATAVQRRPLLRHLGPVNAVSFSPDGNTIVSASEDGTLRLWDAKSGREIRRLTVSSRIGIELTFSPCGRKVVSGSFDGALRIWEPAIEATAPAPDHCPGTACTLRFSPDGATVAWIPANWGGCLRLWDVQSGTFRGQLQNRKRWLSEDTLIFSPDSSLLAAYEGGDSLRLWDTTSGASKGTMPDNYVSRKEIIFSPDSTMLAISTVNKEIQLWDVVSCKCKYAFRWEFDDEKDYRWCRPLAFSPSCRIIVSVSNHGTIVHKSWPDDRVVWKLEGQGQEVCAAAFSDNEKFAWASRDGTIHLSDGGELLGPRLRSESIVFSPGGSKVAVISDQGHLWLWDVATRTQIWKYQGPCKVTATRFSPDGSRIIPALLRRDYSFLKDEDLISWDPRESDDGHTDRSRPELGFPINDDADGFTIATTRCPSGTAHIDYYDISRAGWITRGSQRILRLPPGSRTRQYAANGSTMAIDYGTERVLILRFRSERTDEGFLHTTGPVDTSHPSW